MDVIKRTVSFNIIIYKPLPKPIEHVHCVLAKWKLATSNVSHGLLITSVRTSGRAFVCVCQDNLARIETVSLECNAEPLWHAHSILVFAWLHKTAWGLAVRMLYNNLHQIEQQRHEFCMGCFITNIVAHIVPLNENTKILSSGPTVRIIYDS